MKFKQFQTLIDNLFMPGEDGIPMAKYADVPVDRLPALVLAYVGDAYFSLYVRTRLLAYEQQKVRVLHTYDAKIVSAVSQAKALKEMEQSLSKAEMDIIRRGRNAKSTVPKSASVSEYRYSTGFEALLGYLYLSGEYRRLLEIAGQAFEIISREMTKKDRGVDK